MTHPEAYPLRVAIATSFSPLTAMPRLRDVCEALGRELSRPTSAHLMVSYDDFILGAEADAFHVLWLPPMVALSLVPKGVVKPVAVPIRHGLTSYAAALFTRPGSELSSLADLRGKKAGWVDTKSSAGYLLPRAMLAEAGIDPDTDLAGQELLGSHHRVAGAVLSGSVDFGATYVNLDEDAGGQETIARAGWGRREVQVIARSSNIPNDLLAVGRALDETAAEEVQATLLRPEGALFERLCELLQCDGFVAPQTSHLEGLRAGLLAP